MSFLSAGLPSSVVVTDGDIALSMIPDTTEASAEGETQGMYS